MHSLVGLGGLRQCGEESGRRSVILAAKLTSVAGFEVCSDVGVHAGPVETLQKALFSFVDTIMTDQQISVCL